MRTISLSLYCSRSFGGTFQYTLSILNAFISLPDSKYKKTIFVFHDDWKIYCEELKNLDIIYASYNHSFDRLLQLLLFINIPINVLKRIGSMFHPGIRSINLSNSEIVIFPSQEIWSCLINGKFISSILDLMHRYEGIYDSLNKITYYFRENRYKNICNYASGILVDSDLGKLQTIESYGNFVKDKCYILPQLPPPYILNSNKKIDSKLISKFNLPQKYIIYPANFWEHKNHINLIYAVKESTTIIKDIHLVLCGSKKRLYKRIIKLIRRLKLTNNVTFLGYLSDLEIVQLYLHSTALIYPTFFGPTNIPPIEALHLGCPMAVSDVYAHKEQVGDSAIYFNPHDISQIKSAIIRLWNEPKKIRKHSVNGQKSILFSTMQFQDKFEQIIEKISN